MRINARLDDEREQKLEELKRLNDCNTTTVVLQAIDLLYKEQVGAANTALRAFMESPFVGCCEGPEDGSENYKIHLGASIANKHDSG